MPVKTTTQRLGDGNKYLFPTVITTSIMCLALIEVFPYFEDRPNAVFVTTIVLFWMINNLLIIVKPYLKKLINR